MCANRNSCKLAIHRRFKGLEKFVKSMKMLANAVTIGLSGLEARKKINAIRE